MQLQKNTQKSKSLIKALKLTTIIVLVLGIVAGRVGYTQIFPLVKDEVGSPPATPALLGPFKDDPPVQTLNEWQTRRAPLLRQAFAENVYGALPPEMPVNILKRQSFEGKKLGKGMTVEQLSLGFGTKDERGKANIVLVRPSDNRPVHAVILMQNFCGNHVAFLQRYKDIQSITPPPKMCGGVMSNVAKIILGKYISSPPFENIIARGYAVVEVYTGDVVPDDPQGSVMGLSRLYGDAPKGGALAAWAWMYSQMATVIKKEPGLETVPMVAWGHSRNGKAALLAGASYANIDAVIAHQSGKGGTTLTRSYEGESVAQITKEYGYWFNSQYETYSGREADIPVDQHQLIALMAPKPLLIGTGDRDKWSDPSGSLRAAQAASEVYSLYGVGGFKPKRPSDMDLTSRLSFFMREGPHGVRTGDWEKFLTFLDGQYKAQ
jgi:hypothetical protein